MLNKFIDKYCKMKTHFVRRGVLKLNALIGFIRVPTVYLNGYFSASHNNRYASFLMHQALNELGYTTYLQDYNDTFSFPDVKIDLFVGHGPMFNIVARKLKNKNPDCKCILLLTGSNPPFGNMQQHLRAEYLKARRGIDIKVYEDNIVGKHDENFMVADKILLLGNEFVRSTYPANIRNKITIINNVTPLQRIHRNKRTNNFIFMSSIGQVHRGLDLVLETFEKRSEKIYICSNFMEENDFVMHYKKQLFETKNIDAVGYIKIGSRKYWKILNNVTFAILPSCSEGQSSSILNLIVHGIIPVVPENVGIPDLNKFGFCINGDTLQDVESAVEKAISASDEDILRLQNYLFANSYIFQKDAFKIKLKNTLRRDIC